MTTTKVTAAPFATTAYSNELLTTTSTPQATFDASANATFKLLNTFKLFIIG
jgi:hypothetical protein